MKNVKLILYIFIVILITACGPSPSKDSEHSSTLPTSNSIKTTSNIIADPDFNFRVDKSIEISFLDFPSHIGKVNIYSHFEYYDETLNRYYPDNSTLIASYIASTEFIFPIQVNRNLQHLIIEWLPMDGKSDEAYLFLPLTESKRYFINFTNETYY